jgi:hypothetical protein
METMDWKNERPREQAFMQWRRLADTLAKPEPSGSAWQAAVDAR